MKNLIKIRNLKKSYGNIPVLKNISMDIGESSRYGLIGRSGTGKSTLLRCINGLEDYDSGTLIVNGVNIKDLDSKEKRELRKDIGMIFQEFSLLNRLNVYDNIALPLKCWKYKPEYIDNRVKELAELVGIKDKLYNKPKELSGGQKQRVAIARALSMDPKIVLCDEATSALDPRTSQAIVKLLRDINEELGITLVVVTHEMSVLKRICQEISILESGLVAAKGSLEEVFRAQPKALKNLIGDRNIVIPEEGTSIEIYFTNDNYHLPLVSRMSRDLNIDIFLVYGDLDGEGKQGFGSIVINVKDEDLNKVINYLKDLDLVWNIMR